MKPIDIDEGEEIERITALKHRETLIRGMGKNIISKKYIINHLKKTGVVDMCHRVLFGTSGTMANLPLTNPIIAPSHVQHSVVSISFDISFWSSNFV